MAQPPEHILLARFSSLGDLVRVVRHRNSLKMLWPTCRIDLLTSPLGRGLYEPLGLFDAIHVWDRKAGLSGKRAMVGHIRRQRYDLYLDVHGNRLGHYLGWCVRARRKQRVNHYLLRQLPVRPTRPLSLRRMLERAGYGVPGDHALDADPAMAHIDVPPVMQQRARDLLMQHGWDGQRPLLVVAPGSSVPWPSKRWGIDRFACLIQRAAAAGDLPVLIGDASERELAQQALSLVPVGRDGINLAGQTGLADLLGICSLAKAAVTHDSGPMHLAAVVGTPTLALFGPTDPKRHGPDRFYGPPHQALSAHVACSPCYHGHCPLPRHECMLAISVDQVWEKVKRMGDSGWRMADGG